MLIALTHNHFDESHLEEVKKEMIKLGAPTIKAVWMEVFGHWAAMEGCHRIRAAKELGLTPIIEEVEYSEETTLEVLGCDDSGEGYTVSYIADTSYSSNVFEFDEDE